MAAVRRLEGSLERVLGQRKVSSLFSMCCNHYMAPLGTAVAPGDTPGHAICWSHASKRPLLTISMASVLPQVLDLSTQPWGSERKVVGVSEQRWTEHDPTCLKSGDLANSHLAESFSAKACHQTENKNIHSKFWDVKIG